MYLFIYLAYVYKSTKLYETMNLSNILFIYLLNIEYLLSLFGYLFTHSLNLLNIDYLFICLFIHPFIDY